MPYIQSNVEIINQIRPFIHEMGWKDLVDIGGDSVGEDVAIGKIHRLWWWCLTFAIDGDLSKFSPQEISKAMEINPLDADKTMKALVVAGFVDTFPYPRLHGWWGRAGNSIRARLRRNPAKWKEIQRSYAGEEFLSGDTIVDIVDRTDDEIPPESVMEDVQVLKDVVDKWNRLAVEHSLPRVTAITPVRKKHIIKRLTEEEFDYGKILKNIGSSKWLCGDNPSQWKVSFNWIFFYRDNYIKVLEGNYADKKPKENRREFSVLAEQMMGGK